MQNRNETMAKRIVITGGGGTGKSTIIEELLQRGYCAYREVAREVIRKSLEDECDDLPWKDVTGFSYKVQQGMLLDYKETESIELCFFDRCLLDVKAYLELEGLPVYEELNKDIASYSYFPLVFVLPPWREIFENDEERMEEFDHSVKAYNQLKETYSQHGYELIDVPFGSAQDRVDFIVNHVEAVLE